MLSKILIADDEQTFALTTAALLREKGHDCSTAFDADSARKLLASEVFDVVIADIRMPGNANLEWVRELNEAQAQFPVILSTGYPSVESAVASLNLYVVEYLIKPFDFSRLEAAIRRAKRSRVVLNQLGEHNLRTQHELSRIRQLLDQSHLLARADGPRYEHLVQYQISKIQAALHDLAVLSNRNRADIASSAAPSNGCPLMDCPSQAALVAVIREAVDVLEQTKSSFKSRQLADLRQKLAAAINLH